VDKNSNRFDYFINIGERLEKIENNSTVANRNHGISHRVILNLKDIILHQSTYDAQQSHPNPLNRFGTKCFSQGDEDGITLEIVKRLGIDKGVFLEFGVQNGLECNTLILGALGWRGFWVGGEDLAFDHSKTTRLSYIKAWITVENVWELTRRALQEMQASEIDVASMDLDGNDIYFVEELLSNGFLPKLFIVEYHAKFPPPTQFQMKYDPNHRWIGDDYFGAALTNFVNMFKKFEYSLICCNSQTGANAFFVRNEFLHLFTDVPSDISSLYVAPRYHLYHRFGHPSSVKVVEALFTDE
jgi:hypothetical protein